MVANILPANLPLHSTLGVKRSMVMLHIKLKGITNSANGSNYFARRPPPPTITGGWVQKAKYFFQNMVMLHIKLNRLTNAATW